jgi:hypothetical protein
MTRECKTTTSPQLCAPGLSDSISYSTIGKLNFILMHKNGTEGKIDISIWSSGGETLCVLLDQPIDRFTEAV